MKKCVLIRLKLCMMVFLVMKMLSIVTIKVAGAAVFNVNNETESQDALNQAKTNGQDDTINVMAELGVGHSRETETLLKSAKSL